MSRPPSEDDWKVSHLAGHGRGYLKSGLSFEEIATRIARKCTLEEVMVKPYETPAIDEPKDARQVIFRLSVGSDDGDLLYNGPDGLRGRYWQSPDHGFAANRHLIDQLSGQLLAYSEKNPPTASGKTAAMGPRDIAASLSAPSAKIWVREKDGQGDFLLVEVPPEKQLIVPRWIANEGSASGLWRRTPKGGQLEIKGAILGPDGTEYVPEIKRDRSCQIHRFGFT